jgi:D-alanyl-D-alanine carboxypeptidase (penicillin-binding protein 5/6)
MKRSRHLLAAVAAAVLLSPALGASRLSAAPAAAQSPARSSAAPAAAQSPAGSSAAPAAAQPPAGSAAPAAVQPPAGSAVAAGVPAPPPIAAQAALVMDARTGRVLYAMNPNRRVLPASLAKVMTFDLALRALRAGTVRLDTPVTISKAAWELSVDQAVSHMFLRVGSQVPFQDLLYGLMVSSGNDAAEAIAEELAPTPQAFVARMNAEAARLGLRDTHYVDPHGLATRGTYTSALDVATLIRHVWLTYPDATRYTSPPSFTWSGIKQYNWNELISGTDGVQPDPRVNGFKTGHLQESGYHLAATAVSGDVRLIAVVLGAASLYQRAAQAEKLLQWGFANWASVPVAWKRAAPGSVRVYEGAAPQVPVAPPGPLWVTVPAAEARRLTLRAQVDWPVVAPVRRGQSVGTLTVAAGGRTVERLPLQAQAAVARGGLLHVAWDALRLLLAHLWLALRRRL